MTTPLRWGILSTGRIAHSFANGLKFAKAAELAAVGSRDGASANRFGDEFGIPRRHASYADLASDSGIDAIYIGTPHNLHMENTLLCLNAGKAVLCEKPFAINAEQGRAMVKLAREKRIFLMEAMWTRFFPLMRRLREMIAEGVIGEVRMVSADFGFRAEVNAESRLFAPAYGGGSLLDVGIYPVSFAFMLLGKPSAIASKAHLGATGVDEEAAMILKYDRGQLAVLHSAIRTESLHEAIVMGTRGSIRVHAPFWKPSVMTLTNEDGALKRIKLAYKGNGYQFQAEEVMACLREGRTESSIMPLDESIAIMETLDAIRAQWGLTYPME